MTISHADGDTLRTANLTAPPSQTNITTAEHYGRVRHLTDWYTPTSTGVGLSDDIIMGRAPIPAGSRVLGGHWSCGAVGAGTAQFLVSMDTVANVGDTTPAIFLYPHEDDSYAVDAANSGMLIPWDGTANTPYLSKTPSDFVAWINPEVAVWTGTGTFCLTIYYVFD